MSETIPEIAAREAEEAERENPEPEPDTEPTEPEPEPDTEAHGERVAEAERALNMQEREKQLRREDTRHENALKRVYGEDFALRVRCIVCDGEGFVEQSPELLGLLVQLGDDAREALGDAPMHLRQDPATEQCQVCGGYGTLLTGALADTTRTRQCAACGALGYIDLAEAARRKQLGIAPDNGTTTPVYPVFHGSANTTTTLDPAPSAPDGWESAGRPGADSWGRWPGHPRYGVDPMHGGW